MKKIYDVPPLLMVINFSGTVLFTASALISDYQIDQADAMQDAQRRFLSAIIAGFFWLGFCITARK